MHSVTRNRIRVIAALVLLASIVFIGRLYFLQVIHGKDFQAEAEKQYIASVPNLYDRGNIFFRDKEGKLVTAATINSGYLVTIKPKDIIDKEETYHILSRIIPLNHDDFIAKAKKDDDPYEEIAKRVSEKDMEKIKELKLPGVHMFRETWRYYPSGSLAAQMIGFVGYSGDELTGQYGVESYYNDVLSRNKKNLYVNFFAELFTNIGETVFDRRIEDEGDLVLTVEPGVQAFLESELQGIVNEWRSDETGGIIMDPKTGAIYAMAVNPSFDLNQYGKVKKGEIYANPVVQNDYEMGSIVKPLTMAAGIDTGVVSAETTYNDTGSVTLNNKTFGNHDGRGRGPGTTMQRVLNDSLNTGAAFVVSKLGNQRFADYMLHRYHLGEETGIDLPGEIPGLMSNLSSRRDLEYAVAAFGQGIAMTPINVTTALASLGNGGFIVSPHVVDEIRYDSGKIKKFSPNPPERVLKKETSDEITRMLVNVVDQALLGGTVKIPEYSIAAKTGTAQIALPDGRGYYDDRYLHTFFGYFPAYDPTFIIFLYTYYPKEAQFASHTLTHPFMRLTKYLLNYYNIPPDRESSVARTDLLKHSVN